MFNEVVQVELSVMKRYHVKKRKPGLFWKRKNCYLTDRQTVKTLQRARRRDASTGIIDDNKMTTDVPQ
jgi:hypothetical protein